MRKRSVTLGIGTSQNTSGVLGVVLDDVSNKEAAAQLPPLSAQEISESTETALSKAVLVNIRREAKCISKRSR